jgi:hypothetical protein
VLFAGILPLGNFLANTACISLMDFVYTYAFTVIFLSCKEYSIVENRPVQCTNTTHKHFSTAKPQVIDITETASLNRIQKDLISSIFYKSVHLVYQKLNETKSFLMKQNPFLISHASGPVLSGTLYVCPLNYV